MARRLILASGSHIRQKLLRDAGLEFDILTKEIDETALRDVLLQQGASPQIIAETLALKKAVVISEDVKDTLVIGCDQILALGSEIFSKPQSQQQARQQLEQLRGGAHELLSAVVVCLNGKDIWRHTGHVRLQMRDFSGAFLEGYLERNWPSIRQSVGGYKLEEEGIRLFSAIEGDYFTVLGLPLLALLGYLTQSGELEE